MEQDLAQFIVRTVTESPTVVYGSRLGAEIKKQFPDVNLKVYGGLRMFIEAFCEDSVAFVGKKGGDDVYVYAKRQVPQEFESGITFWRIFVGPNAAESLAVDPSGALRVVAPSQPPLPDAKIIPSLTQDDHREFAQRFVTKLEEADRPLFASVLVEKNFYPRWSQAIRSNGAGKYSKAWLAFRSAQIIELFTQRLQNAGFSEAAIATATRLLIHSKSGQLANSRTPAPECFLVVPSSPVPATLRQALYESIANAGYRIVMPSELRGAAASTNLTGDLGRVDCVVADVGSGDPTALLAIGMARAMGKRVFLIADLERQYEISPILQGFPLFTYLNSPVSIGQLSEVLTHNLLAYRRSPKRMRFYRGFGYSQPFEIDWDKLQREDAENLCRELLSQMGYKRLDWYKASSEFDLVAELPKSDPDGYEYRELWLISMGRNAPADLIADIAKRDLDHLVHRLLRFDDRAGRIMSRSAGGSIVTVLLILLSDAPQQLSLFDADEYLNERLHRGPLNSGIRFRIWDRRYLSKLLEQVPQLAYKYFSDESRSRSKFRRTPEELYTENIDLSNRLALTNSELGATIKALDEEKNRRVRAERDAIWKDISFSAAHKIGNPIFAIETNLDPLETRISEARKSEALEVSGHIRSSVERAKGIIDQFKSLTRAQQIKLSSVALKPILEDVCIMASDLGVSCKIDCDFNFFVEGDSDRLTECFEELTTNAVRWMSGALKEIAITAKEATAPLPAMLDSERRHALIHFKDSGIGIPVENKELYGQNTHRRRRERKSRRTSVVLRRSESYLADFYCEG